MNIFGKGRVKAISQQSINNFPRKLQEGKRRIIHSFKRQNNTQNKVKIEVLYIYKKKVLMVRSFEQWPSSKGRQLYHYNC